MGNNSHKPAIRFQGFTDAWEQRKVSDVCSISTGKSNTQDKVEDGTYPFYVRSPIIERSNRYLYDEEAVLTVGDGVGTGKVFHYVNGKYDLHQRVYRLFDFSDDVNAKFFYYWFSDHFYDRVMSMTAKTSVDSVRLEMIADMEMTAPSYDEQSKISGCLDHIDNLITLHQRKYEKLLTIKKSMLEKMFPRDGSNNPEIRFIGFTDPWEQRKLGEWCDFINGDRSSNYPSATEFVENGIPFVGSDSLGSTLVDKTKLRFITTEKYEQMNGLKIEANDILYTLRGAGFGKCSIADFTGGTVASSLVGIRCKEILRSKFLIQWLCSSNAEHEKNKAVNGSTAQNISVEDMKKYNVTVPSLAEQEKISEYLYNLDNLITLHHLKLEKLKNIKQSLLQNMFV